MAGHRVYIHGYSDEEAGRLVEQAEFLAQWVMEDINLASYRSVLEVGIGVGAETRLLRARWPHLRVVGLDVSGDQVARARRVLHYDVLSGAVKLMVASAD